MMKTCLWVPIGLVMGGSLQVMAQDKNTAEAARPKTPEAAQVRTGNTALTDDWTSDAPGVRRHLKAVKNKPAMTRATASGA